MVNRRPQTAQPTSAAPGAKQSNGLAGDVYGYLTKQDYRPGQALPAGLIAHRLWAEAADVNQALEELAAAGVVVHQPSGPYGNAFYLPNGAWKPRSRGAS
ncbi:hypothetical protein AB0J01_37920 [Streptomyces sp. NPDC050204]|uniref:hypothetical protein n=1 Tax=Streptomyces sp. NPDC050204 TaxID=3155514 RepID=UPI0034394A9E